MQPLNALEKDLLRQWLCKADGGLRLAERLADAPKDFDAVAFHCQQAVEKYWKARLAATGADPPRACDLVRPLLLLEAVETFSGAESNMVRQLTPFGVAIRYPSEEEEPPVAELLAAARHFRDRLRPAIESELT